MKQSFARKKARRVFQQYDIRVDKFSLPNGEEIAFANWLNPLVKPKEITQHEMDFFRQYIPEGSLAIDIGANVGDLTVSMAVAAGPEGLVLALDPNPHVFRVLEANAALNRGKANIVPLQLAATEEETLFYFASSDASMGNGGLITDLDDNRHGKYKLKDPIRGVNLGKYLQEHYKDRLPKLSLIKVDVEGLDYYVLRSLEPVLEKYHPVIITEVFHDISVQMREDTFHLLKKYDYKLQDVGDFHTEAPLSARPVNTKEDMPKMGRTSNLIAS
ncbi:MAG TPA: FkbM family methyltransferase [Chitinophaga sp.]